MTGDGLQDPLWEHFSPLWTDLSPIASDDLLVAGGYGLYLKQRFLRANPTLPIVVPLDRWLDATPRVTKDLDLVIGLQLIAAQERHQSILDALNRNGFRVSDRPSGRRWQFVKTLLDSRVVLVELHAPRPENSHPTVMATEQRVKHKPSLGDAGIHGRTNPEAAGCELSPFRFELDGITAAVVNPVTWSVMKLTAMDDRWSGAQDSVSIDNVRTFARQQAIKHAHDVCRIIASMTRSELEAAELVRDSLRNTPPFSRVVSIWNDAFRNEMTPPALSAMRNWALEDFEIIRGIGNRWFVQADSDSAGSK
ncbi:MAG: hypothetical protein JNM43_23475 [Planctomycetaceae bacterium]|nr:hypothetical protein [Planctomycetaceae bacterium]